MIEKTKHDFHVWILADWYMYQGSSLANILSN